MKKVIIAILCICAFIACTAIGFLSGIGEPKSPQTPAANPPKNSQRTVTPPQYRNQQNLILMQVDNLAAPRPRLEAAWLMIYMPNQPDVNLLMLYPSNKESYKKLADKFKLTPSRELDADFNNTLLSFGFGYQGFIIVDETGFTNWIDWLGGVDVGSGKQDGLAVLKQLPMPWTDIDNAVTRQKITSNSICNVMSLLPMETDWSALLVELMPAHLLSNLTLQDAVTTWQHMKDGQARFHCVVLTP
jgi:hypothetical protein